MKQQITPYLTFEGDAREALDFYKEVFQGEVVGIQTYGEADFPTPPEADHFVMHAQFKKDQLFFMVSDAFPGQPVQKGNQISLTLEPDNEEELQGIYDALTPNGTVLMELQDTFWGAKYAKVRDKFGVIWDLNYTKS